MFIVYNPTSCLRPSILNWLETENSELPSQKKHWHIDASMQVDEK